MTKMNMSGINRAALCAGVVALSFGAGAGSWITGSYDLAGSYVQSKGDDLYLTTGPFTLSKDASIKSAQCNGSITFDFTDGDHTLTLTRADKYVFSVMGANLHIRCKGGTWKTEVGAPFQVCQRGIYSSIPSDVSPTMLTLSDGCVIDWMKGSTFMIGGSTSGSVLEVTDGSKVQVSEFRLSSWGGVNMLRVLSGGEVSVDDLYYDRNTTGTALCTNTVEIAGTDSKVTINDKGGVDMGPHRGGIITIRDGGAMSMGGWLYMSKAGSAKLDVRDNASITTGRLLLYGNSTAVFSNATANVGGVYAKGSGNVVELLDPVAVSSPGAIVFNADSIVATNCRFTASGVNAQPKLTQWPFGSISTNCVFELKDKASCVASVSDRLQLMINATNNVFRLSGGATFTSSKDVTLGSNWGCKCADNVLEILDDAQFTVPFFRLTGYRNRVVVSNATFTVTGSSTVIFGHGTNNNKDVFVISGEKPKVTMPTLQFGTSSVLRFEVPETGYPKDHVAVELSGSLAFNLSDKLEIDCSKWTAGRSEIVLLRQSTAPDSAFTSRVSNARSNLPKGYRLKFVDNDLVLTRPAGTMLLIK